MSLYTSSSSEDTSSISSSSSSETIDQLFDAKLIKNIIESLVFQKFRFKKKLSKQELLIDNDSQVYNFNSSQFLHDALGSNYNLLDETFSEESSVHTSNILTLISQDYSVRTNASLMFTPSSLDFKIKNYYTILESLNYKRDQVLKAIYYDSFSRKEKKLSEERIEAEKLLLLLDIKSNVCSKLLENSVNSAFNESSPFQQCTATVFLSHIQFMLNDLKNISSKFLCVVTFGSNVLASELISTRGNNLIQVKSKFMITSIKREETININLYAIRKTQNYSTWSIPSMCHLQQKININDTEIPERSSLFKLCASSCVTIADLIKLHSHPSGSIEIESGWLSAEVNIFLNLSVDEAKFINVSKNPKSHPIWNLQWCVLNNIALKYYNYPSDATPVDEIDLEQCSIQQLAHNDYSTKRTIQLTTHQGDNYLFSFNTENESQLWRNSLNYIISNLKLWKF